MGEGLIRTPFPDNYGADSHNLLCTYSLSGQFFGHQVIVAHVACVSGREDDGRSGLPAFSRPDERVRYIVATGRRPPAHVHVTLRLRCFIVKLKL